MAQLLRRRPIVMPIVHVGVVGLSLATARYGDHARLCHCIHVNAIKVCHKPNEAGPQSGGGALYNPNISYKP